jgi:hypothetical protein
VPPTRGAAGAAPPLGGMVLPTGGVGKWRAKSILEI